MNLVIIAALVAVCGAAKLDRTYLPPATAETAGGSSDSLQTPFSRSSANQGAEGLPSGSYTNEFQGVVVDAINPATRVSSGSEQTGLGAPRVSYGSTASKVGDAAFRESVAGFRLTPSQTGFESASDGQVSGTQITPEYNQGPFVARPERPQAASDRNANIIRQDSDVGAETYSYGYETDNGISAIENGVATNGVQAQGGFSYKGDDGQVYSIMYTADEGGYRPVGNHLPTPPPIPEEILKSLEQNAREEAAGIVDDGTYDAQKYNDGGDYPESHNDRQSPQFGNRPESATGSTFINQNQAFGKPTFNTGFSVLGSNVNNRPSSDATAFAQSGNGFGSNQNQPSANIFTQGSDISSQGQDSSDAAISGQFSQSAQASSQTGPFGPAETVAQSSSGTHLGQTPGFGNEGSTGSQFTQQFSQDSRPQFGAQPSRPQFGQNQIPTSGNAQASSSNSGSTASVSGYQYGGQQGSGPQFGGQPSRPQFGSNQIPTSGGALASGSFTQNSRPQFSSQAQLFKPEGFAPDSNSASSFNLGQNTQASGNFQQLSEGRPQGFISQTTFNRPSSSSSGQGSFNAASNAFGSSPNSASSINGQSNQGNDLANNNEYLPPINTNSNGRDTQSSQPQKPEIAPALSVNQFTSNTQTSNNIPTLSGQDRPQGFQQSLASVGSQPTFSTQSGQFGFQQTQSPNNVRPSQFTQNTINFPSTQSQNQYTSNSNSPQYNSNAQPIQSTSTFTASSQLATSQPEIELTTPLEPNESSPNSADGSQPSGSSASSFASFGTQPSNARPGQPQFGASFQSGLNPSPFATQATATAFSSLSPTSQPLRQKPFGTSNVQSQSAFPTQASFNPTLQFGDRIPQNKGDAQFASSTIKPSFSLTSQPQGNDDSYYYNQPSKPFGTPTNRPLGSKFSSASQNRFNNVNSQSSFGQNSFSNNRQPNVPANSLPSRNEQLQGQPGKPSAPTIAPIAPTTATQKETGASQSYYNGIIQASISPFAGAPTPSTQFGSRPQLPSTQFNQPQSQAGINQASASQQTFPKRPTNQFAQKPASFQSQSQSQSGQASVSQSQPESPEDNASQSMPSQQYNGEVYEYNKPEEVLPAPEQTDSTSNQNVQSNIQTDSSDNKSNEPEGSKPAFGTRPQVDQNPQPTQGSVNVQEIQGSRTQFGAQPSRPFGTRTQQSTGSKPQHNSPFGKPCCQGNKFGQTAQSTQDTNQFGRPMQGTQTPSQFNVQTTGFQGTQTFKPGQVSQGFGRGEIFGGPRDPPRFDDKTGYHY